MSASVTMIRVSIGLTVVVVAFLSLVEGTTTTATTTTPLKSKRQIYREQVLPSRGGKIPDGAFRSDRLALNRLNKEGISIPDGVLLEHRHVHAHPHINQHDPEDEDSLIKIVQQPEDRYVSSAGKYHNKRPLTVSSTYIIRKPVESEGTGIRTPVEQVPIYDTFSQHQGNQISYQPYQETYHQSYTPQYISSEVSIPSNKYLPTDLSAPTYQTSIQSIPTKYIPADIASPPSKYLSGLVAPPATVVHHPHPFGYNPPVSYQQLHQSVAYYPVTVPLELPNKETLKSDYYYHSKSQGSAFGRPRNPEDVHGVISWPYLLGQYTRLSDKINALDHDSYGHSTPHSLFFTPEVLGSIDSGSNYYTTRDRYARKSKEIAFTEAGPEANGKNRTPKDGPRLIKLKCTRKLDNSVEDGSSQCFIRY